MESVKLFLGLCLAVVVKETTVTAVGLQDCDNYTAISNELFESLHDVDTNRMLTETAPGVQALLSKLCDNRLDYILERIDDAIPGACDNRLYMSGQVTKMFNFCPSDSWVRKYVIPNLNNVNQPACRRLYFGVCKDVSSEIRRPDDTLTVEKGLANAKHNVDVTFNCMKNDLQANIRKVPECTARWQDLFASMIVNVVKYPMYGYRLYPEHIEQLAVIME